MKKDIHIMNPKKQKKYVSPYYFLFYSQHELTTIQLNFKNSEIKKIKRYASSGI